MSARAAFGAALAAVLVLALVPWSDGPLRRLAGEGESGGAPTLDAPLAIAEVHKLGPRIPDGGTYVVLANGRTPLEQGNLKAVGQLYLSHALPVQDVSRADWTLRLRGNEAVLRPR